MATHIRLKRVGAKKEASYRIIVTDSREGTSGAAIERLGLYNPRTQPSLVRLDAARTLYWLNEGATPSDTVRSILQKTGVWKQFHDGVEVASLEEATVVLGPPEGQRGTSQRPMPDDKAQQAEAAPEAKPKAKAAPAAEKAAAAEEPAAEAAEEPAAEAAEEPAAEDAADVSAEDAPDAAEAEAEAEAEAPADDAPAEAEASAEEAATEEAGDAGDEEADDEAKE